MLILIVLLACLVSILMVTLLNIVSVNAQITLFLLVLIVMILFKIILDSMVKSNKNNPVSKNIISNVNLQTQSALNVLPSNFNLEVNSVNNVNNTIPEHAFVNVPTTNNQVANNPVANNPVGNNPLGNNPVGNNPVGNNPVGNNPVGNNPVGNNPVGNNPVGNNPLGNNPVVNNTSTNDGSTCVVDNSCLLENTPCKQINQKACSTARHSDNTNPCSAQSATNLINGEKVNKNCLMNNTINFNDVFNVDSPNTQYNDVILPPSGINNNDCAFNNTCIVPNDNANMHLASEYSPGDPEFAETQDFWKFKANNNDLCYVKRVLPEFYNFDN